jgi:hypothetical protein
VAAAHQLHGPSVALLAQRADDLDGVRLAECDIEKDDLGVALLQGRHRVRCHMEALGGETQAAERHRDETVRLQML